MCAPNLKLIVTTAIPHLAMGGVINLVVVSMDIPEFVSFYTS